MVPTHRRGLCQRHRQVERPPAWRSRGGQIFVPDGDAPRPALRRLSLPRRAHQLCGLAVFPVPAELADGRRDAGCSRHSVTYETIRQWGLKFGQEFANRIRRRAPRRGDKWHLDEVVLSIAGKKHWRWRAVDQEGFVLDVLVQSRRDKKAAKRWPANEKETSGIDAVWQDRGVVQGRPTCWRRPRRSASF